MPFYLHEADITPAVADLKSLLIVPCRFCPAASLAVTENKPYFEPFRRLLRTEAYESYIHGLKSRLEFEGVEVEKPSEPEPEPVAAVAGDAEESDEPDEAE